MRPPSDPHISVLLDRAAAVREASFRVVLETRRALAATDQLLRAARRLLGDRPCRPAEVRAR